MNTESTSQERGFLTGVFFGTGSGVITEHLSIAVLVMVLSWLVGVGVNRLFD